MDLVLMSAPMVFQTLRRSVIVRASSSFAFAQAAMARASPGFLVRSEQRTSARFRSLPAELEEAGALRMMRRK